MKKMKMLAVFLVLILTAPAMLLAEATQVLPQVQTYDQLLAAIRAARNASQARIEAMAGQEKVREAWETGRLIDTHVLQHKERADYGKQVLKRLAKDLDTSQTELSFMLQFARAYPIYSPANKLSWAHYRELLAVNDPQERDEVAKEATEKRWTRDQVRQEVKARKIGGDSPFKDPEGSSSLKDIAPGPLDTFQIIRLGDSLKIDLGFGIYRDLPGKDAAEYKEGDIVIVSQDLKEGYKLSAISSSESRGTSPESLLYTYRAKATQVVDGDTFHALIDLGFGTTLAQRVRLRRIDAPEIESREGKDAKAVLEEILARDQGRVILQSRELDQHGRPIADVWVEGKSIDQELLDQGLAVKMED